MIDRWFKTAVLATSLGVLVLANPVLARDHRGMGFGSLVHETRMTRALDLDETQQARMREITQAAREEARPHVEAMMNAKDELRQLGRGEGFDEAEVRRVARLRADAMVELTVLRGRMRHEVDAILTPEQRARKAAMRERRGKKHRHGRDGSW